MEISRPKVGLGVYILNQKNEVLLLCRRGAHGAGTWCPPGGHLEFGESFEECAQREAKEESGLNINTPELVRVTNDVFSSEGKHYVTIHMVARNYQGEPRLIEEDKSDAIDWFPLNALPSPLFLSMANFFATNPLCLCDSGKSHRECHGA